jgi:hypothetical protein
MQNTGPCWDPVPADSIAGAVNPGNVGFADAPGIEPRWDSDEPLRTSGYLCAAGCPARAAGAVVRAAGAAAG